MLRKNSKLKFIVTIAATTAIITGIILPVNFTSKENVNAKAANKPKNVILLIADGMSNSATNVARYYKDSQDGIWGNDSLYIDDYLTGYSKTQWNKGPITDSAPGGTALSCGVKSDDSHVGVTPDDIPIASVLEAAQDQGKATGIIATCEIMHATPSDFTAHNASRSDYNSLMKQQIYNNVDVVLGGGDKFLYDKDGNGKRKDDNKDLTEEIKELGYDYITTKDEMNSTTSNKIWGMFADTDMAYEGDRQEFNKEQPTLAEMTNKAIEVLSKDEDGFFLMVEGSKIDWAAHANDTAGMVNDILAYDDAVKTAIEFAKKDKNTVVISTTDHGNSGISIGNSDTTNSYSKMTFDESVGNLKGYKLSKPKFNEIINGKTDEEISGLVEKYFGITNLTVDELALIKAGNIEKVEASRAKLGFTTTGHTGGDVAVYTYAPEGIDVISGVVDNTYIAKYIEKQISLDLAGTTSKRFADISSEISKLGGTIEVDTTDKLNPVAIIKKNNKEVIKLYVNTNVVEAGGKKQSINGVIVYSANKLFASEEIIDLYKGI
ncbi:alkaline phosphatase [Clostridium bornimense]|uniref:Alkaline phosphatase n=1 Tax=Clostridium bornimense TaxID=1216932 RepID=W6S599_9CLOT|nr:alkaline phosphatase [Clostridium bornimense]CDM69522.1 alkaline phosphatase [Clostridium bornimense]